MKIQFLGATKTVTGSKYLLEHGSRKYLIDCGLFQGVKSLRLRNWEELPIKVSEIDAIVLTHAHIDHSGYIPRLVKAGFKGPIYSTPATRDLCKILLPDCGHIMEEEANYLNRRKKTKHHPALPLFTIEDARQALSYFSSVQYKESFDLGDGLSFSFSNAGHILGSAHVLFSDGTKSITFSGDIGRPDDAMMYPPEPPAKTDYLVMESTYGNRSHPLTHVEDDLAEIINRTIERKGTIIVPAFAVGRAQLILHLVSKLKKENRIPSFPIYLNSPMATSVSNIYCEHNYNHRLSTDECHEMCDVATYVNTADESKALNINSKPKLIISASGMATGGRVIHHIKAFGPDPKSTLLFAGFQAGGTRGEKIVSGAETVKIHGQEIPIRAEVCNLNHLSAHADKNELINWVESIGQPIQKVFITHGESSSAQTFKESLQSKFSFECHIPEYLEEVQL